MESRKIKDSKYAKGVAWVSLFLAISVTSDLYFKGWSQIVFVLACLGLAGSILLIKREFWGLIILAVYHFPQILTVHAPKFYYNFSVGFYFNVGLTHGPVEWTINPVTLVLFALCVELMWENRTSAKDEMEIEEATMNETANPISKESSQLKSPDKPPSTDSSTASDKEY